MATDQNGDVYLVTWTPYGDWYDFPEPARSHTGNNYSDVAVAKFDGDDGAILWHTFLGGTSEDEGHAIVVDTAQTPPAVYIAGWSGTSWGTPLHPHTFSDAFVARLNGDSGALVWNTFMGSSNGSDEIHAITFDEVGRLVVAGTSREGWGNPVIPHPGGGVGDAAFVAVISTDGQLMGNTFVGGAASSDKGYGVATSAQGDIYAAGTSRSPDSVGWSNLYWGTPIRPFSGTYDAFVAYMGTRDVVRYLIYTPLVIRD